MDRTEDPVNGSLERSEAGVNSVDLNKVLGRTRLGSFLEAVLPPVLSLLWRSRLQLYLLPPCFLTWEVGSSSLASPRPVRRTSGLEIVYPSYW